MLIVDKGVGVITIQSSGSYEYMAYQAENKVTISLKRPQDKENVTFLYKTPNYSGNKLSLDFQDIEVRRVLQLLADFYRHQYGSCSIVYKVISHYV